MFQSIVLWLFTQSLLSPKGICSTCIENLSRLQFTCSQTDLDINNPLILSLGYTCKVDDADGHLNFDITKVYCIDTGHCDQTVTSYRAIYLF